MPAPDREQNSVTDVQSRLSELRDSCKHTDPHARAGPSGLHDWVRLGPARSGPTSEGRGVGCFTLRA
eukprot:4883222-Prymnesium_polylepis.1